MAKRATVAVLTVTAVAGAGVAVGVFLAHGAPGTPAASSSAPAPTSDAGSLDDGSGLDDVSAEPTASIGPDPDTGQSVATDEPVVATGSEVAVTVTFYGWNATSQVVQVGGYVAGVVEEGGVCTLTLTKGGRSVTGRTDAVADASTTACGAVTVPGDRVSAGTWQAVLSYSSAGHSGTSDAVDVEVSP
jgi:hypothetical protein